MKLVTWSLPYKKLQGENTQRWEELVELIWQCLHRSLTAVTDLLDNYIWNIDSEMWFRGMAVDTTLLSIFMWSQFIMFAYMGYIFLPRQILTALLNALCLFCQHICSFPTSGILRNMEILQHFSQTDPRGPIIICVTLHWNVCI